MGKLKKRYVGKIGYCDNADLGISLSGGHYVYIRKYNGSTCDVNVVTSLEDKGFNSNKLNKVKQGYLYAIPKNDTNFSKWSAINLTSIKGVETSKIKTIGIKRIKTRHKWFVGKFYK